jgi:mono/diheme cytochrome c family protein
MPHPLRPQCALPLLALLLTALAPSAHAQSNELGKQVFTSGAEPACALCHTLAAAGAAGEIGPSLDELKPDEEKVRLAVQRGVGNMPPFGEVLSKEQIDAVAKYVAEAVRPK